LLNALVDVDDGELRAKLARSLIERAMEGDSAAMRILWDRIEPTKGIDLTVNNNMANGTDEVLAALERLKAKVANGKNGKR
jgi:hypothetical protein